ILRKGEVEDETTTLTILRDVSDAEIEDLLCPGPGDVGACDVDGTACRASESGKDLDELGLPVPVHAGEADDLAGVHRQGQTANRLDAAVVACPDIVDLEHRG